MENKILAEPFITRTKELLGDEFQLFEEAINSTPPVSIRVNNKMTYQPSNEKVDWCEYGYYLNERPIFTADPLFHAGVYYVQEASSMFLYQAVKQHFPTAQNVLDLCAAPGGKSTILSQLISENSLLVSNEINKSRAYILAENIIKWGNANVIVTNNSPQDFEKIPNFFDAVLVDAPCSGEGMFRKDKDAISEWSLENVKRCHVRQKEILSQSWKTLKSNGILIYSTCTFNTEENEDIVSWICNELGAECLSINLNGNENITRSDWGYRFYPHKTKGEGFFLSVLKKTSPPSNSLNHKIDSKNIIKQLKNDNFSSFKLKNPSDFLIIEKNHQFSAYNKEKINDFLFLIDRLNCIHSGIYLGEMKAKDFIPSACIALSKHIDKEASNIAELDYEKAISFLRKENIVLPNSEKGYILVCFLGQPLGWVKNLGNRCNNLHPNEWRIRMKSFSK